MPSNIFPNDSPASSESSGAPDFPNFVDELKEEKTCLRTQMRRARAELSADTVRICSEQATAHLLAEACICEAKCVALYVSIRHELATQKCIEALWQKGITTLVPRCDPAQAGHMDFIELRQWDELSPRCFGLQEAGGQIPAAKQIPDVLIMPALAVDKQGHRLGQGGGYYDRFLMQKVGKLVPEKPDSLAPQGLWSGVPRIAFVYSLQILETLPHVSHDYTVQAIAHEGGVLWL